MPVTREDIEAKADDLIGAVDQTKTSVQDKAMMGALVVVGVIVAAFVMGRRRGSRSKTTVEVYRV